MGEIEFEDFIVEWDDKKAEINKKKHSVSFELAAEVFWTKIELIILMNFTAITKTDLRLSGWWKKFC